MDWKLALQIVGVALGLLYLWLEYKANIWLWVVGLIMPIVHGTLYFRSGLYADLHVKGFEAVLRTQYVGKQYFTNNEVDALSLDAYCVTNLDLAYTLRTRATKSVRFGVTIYNLFNAEYCSNGYGYSYMWDGERYDEAYYFPQAPLHVLANVTIKF